MDQLVGLGKAKVLHHIENAIITPTTVDTVKRTFTGCVYDRSGQIVKVSQRTNRRVAWKPADPVFLSNHEEIEVISGSFIYLGHYSGHYGHFLLETLSRFWALCENIYYDKLIFQPFIHDTPCPDHFSPAKVCFECFNIKSNQIIMVNKQMRFEHLIIPTGLVEINNQADEEQGMIYNRIAEYCQQEMNRKHSVLHKFLSVPFRNNSKPRRLYLSRKKLRSSHSIINEDEIEKLFSTFGFKIIYPERMNFPKQIILYKEADVIAGFAGSALHNSVFMKSNSLAITLGDLRRPNASHPNQEICDGLSKSRSVFINFEGTTIDTVHKIGRFEIAKLRMILEKLF